jgi:hypothetical protein
MKIGIGGLFRLDARCVAGTAQQKSLRDQIVGTWNLWFAEVVASDGKKSMPFGETPKGILIFTAGGQFAQIHVASDVPKITSNNRLTGTPEEYSAIMRRSISLFGTYSVDEEKENGDVPICVEQLPEFCREAQVRTIDKLTADEFVNTNPNVAGGRGRASNFYKRAM